MKPRTLQQKQAHHQLMLSKAHAARMKRSDNPRDWESTPESLADEGLRRMRIRREIEARRERRDPFDDWFGESK